jgi:hemerythrin-like domain-containing protein
MNFNRQTCRRLHEDHEATLALWNRFEQTAAARTGSELADLARSCAAALAHEISRHFAFEEEELFPRLAEAGEGDIAELLTEEHVVIRSAAQSFSAALEKQDWQQLRTAGLELSERLNAHVQKEEMSLLPAVEDLLDDETDARLALAYAG